MCEEMPNIVATHKQKNEPRLFFNQPALTTCLNQIEYSTCCTILEKSCLRICSMGLARGSHRKRKESYGIRLVEDFFPQATVI